MEGKFKPLLNFRVLNLLSIKVEQIDSLTGTWRKSPIYPRTRFLASRSFLTTGILFFVFSIFMLRFSNTYAEDPIASAVQELGLISKNQEFKKVSAEELSISFPSPPPQPPKKNDPRLEVLQKYLSEFNSPLKDHARDFLDAADFYGVDWKLLPAIAGVESTFGKKIPGGFDPDFTSYNGWGWGVYGHNVIKFRSWREAIFAVTKGIKNGYINQGLTDPMLMNKKYASSPDWGDNVIYFLNDIQQFTSEHLPTDLSEPDYIQPQIFQQYAYLKKEQGQFALQFAD